jgi:hypothetical protein
VNIGEEFNFDEEMGEDEYDENTEEEGSLFDEAVKEEDELDEYEEEEDETTTDKIQVTHILPATSK